MTVAKTGGIFAGIITAALGSFEGVSRYVDSRLDAALEPLTENIELLRAEMQYPRLDERIDRLEEVIFKR